jgi:putative redox protein
MSNSMSKMKAVVFQNNRGQNLVGVMHYGQGKEPSPCLIVCHGFAGTKLEEADVSWNLLDTQ